MRIFFWILMLTSPSWITAQSNSKLFTLLAPESTNVYFQNSITDEKDHNILIYSNYYGGAGVGVGDFNKDGLADLFFAGNLVSDEIYFNLGDFKFRQTNEQSGIKDNGGWSSGVVVADVNNDGWEDIYGTRELYDDQPELRKNLLYINTGETFDLGNGKKGVRFEEQAAIYGLDNSERTRHAGFLDYDNDGWLDLFLLNQPPNPGNYSDLLGTNLMQEKWSPRLFHNNGSNKKTTFTDVSKEAGILLPGYANSMVASDVNKDGWIDIYLTNDYEAPDRLFLNKGNGTFSEVLQSKMNHTSFYSMGVDAADINNDGWQDLMTLDMVAEDNFRIKANMSGMNPKSFWNVVENGGHYQYMFNAMQLNNQGENFSEISQLSGVSSTDWSWSNLIADLDNDGWKDVFVTNGLLRDIRNSDASKTFPEYVREVINEFIEKNPNAGEVGIFDILDLEEALDLLPSVPLKNYVFQNNGDLTFSKKIEAWGLDQETFSNGSSYADLDNDGDLDLIINNINAPAFIYENNSDRLNKNNHLRIQLIDNESNTNLFGTKISIKFDDVKTQFIELTNVRGMYSTSENIAHFGIGKSKKVDEIIITLPNGNQIEKKNIPANSFLKIEINQEVILNKKPISKNVNKLLQSVDDSNLSSFRHRENDFDDYKKQVLLPHKMSQFGPALTKGDINGDGLEDVFIGGAKGQVGQFFIQKKNGEFEAIPMSNDFKNDVDFEDVNALLFDLENDGDLDLYVVSGGNFYAPQNKMYQDRIYLNENGNFKKDQTKIAKFRESGGSVHAADFDQDGDLDLLVGGRHLPWSYPSPTVSRLLKNEDGILKDITKTNASDLIQLGMVTDAVWTDFDGDNDLDFIVVGEWMPISFFENKNGFFEKNNTITNSTGWWYSIEKSDIDNDGDDDYLIGNLGLNYKYKASSTEPFEVHYDDFDENGSKDIVLSYYNFGEQFPLRGRSCSSEQVPLVGEKFPTYNIFASSDINTVYGEDKLGRALHYSAETFASIYLENKGNGNFEMNALPNEAQISSINDFIIKDFDGDGNKDVLLAGNLFTSEIETTRNDAGNGLILKGDGQGNWLPMANSESGINVPYDVKTIQSIKISNGEYILFGCNDSNLKIYKISKVKQ
ncbi:MAG: VCBS repeat-containing protein [Saprospiraceae bacterium]